MKPEPKERAGDQVTLRHTTLSTSVVQLVSPPMKISEVRLESLLPEIREAMEVHIAFMGGQPERYVAMAGDGTDWVVWYPAVPELGDPEPFWAWLTDY